MIQHNSNSKKMKITKGTTVSFLPTSRDVELSLNGFKYSGEHITIPLGSTRGLSNVSVHDEVTVTSSLPVLMFCNCLCEESFFSNF